jgi:alpha-beta hydrolase superfamily lysophospholipase
MKQVKRSTLQGQAGQLAVYDWPLPPSPIRGTVLLVHGLGEHTGRYGHVAEHLRQWGFVVRGYDHQGHGHSDGVRGTLHTDDGLLQDLATVIDDTRERHGAHDAPLILLGHSMGGLVVARAVAEQLRYVDAVVMSSPALGTWANLFQKLLLATLPKYWPDLCVGNGLNPKLIARDAQTVQRYMLDPLVHDRISTRLGAWIYKEGPKTVALAAEWKVPSLLIYAGQDRLVHPDANAAFAAKAPASVVHSHCFAPMYHEIFNDTQHQLVFKVLKRWLDDRFAA